MTDEQQQDPGPQEPPPQEFIPRFHYFLSGIVVAPDKKVVDKRSGAMVTHPGGAVPWNRVLTTVHPLLGPDLTNIQDAVAEQYTVNGRQRGEFVIGSKCKALVQVVTILHVERVPLEQFQAEMAEQAKAQAEAAAQHDEAVEALGKEEVH